MLRLGAGLAGSNSCLPEGEPEIGTFAQQLRSCGWHGMGQSHMAAVSGQWERREPGLDREILFVR